MTNATFLPLANQITSHATSGELVPMYHEERIIDGKVYVRNSPNGSWYVKEDQCKIADAYNAMSKLTDEERMDVMRFFCRECGVKLNGGSCTCWRDE